MPSLDAVWLGEGAWRLAAFDNGTFEGLWLSEHARGAAGCTGNSVGCAVLYNCVIVVGARR